MKPETIEHYKKRTESLKTDILFNEDIVLGPISEAHYLLAVAALEAAIQQMSLAHIYLMRGE